MKQNIRTDTDQQQEVYPVSIKIQERLAELFKESIIANCQADDQILVLEDLTIIGKWSIEQVIDNIQSLIVDLLEFKISTKQQSMMGLEERCYLFEKQIQKLEAEVRKHIGAHHQMKLQLESQANRLEEFYQNQNKGQLQIDFQNASYIQLEKPQKAKVYSRIKAQIRSVYKNKILQLQEQLKQKDVLLKTLQNQSNQLQQSNREKLDQLIQLKERLQKSKNRQKKQKIPYDSSQTPNDVLTTRARLENQYSIPSFHHRKKLKKASVSPQIQNQPMIPQKSTFIDGLKRSSSSTFKGDLILPTTKKEKGNVLSSRHHRNFSEFAVRVRSTRYQNQLNGFDIFTSQHSCLCLRCAFKSNFYLLKGTYETKIISDFFSDNFYLCQKMAKLQS